MQQLLESIGQISRANSDSSEIHFESHVFLDGAVKGDEMSDFALQLVSLLKDALRE
jgi:chitin synthase